MFRFQSIFIQRSNLYPLFFQARIRNTNFTELANLPYRNTSHIPNCNRYNQQIRQKPDILVTIELKVDNMIKKILSKQDYCKFLFEKHSHQVY